MSESSSKPKVLIVATHPVQYQAPWFRYIHHELKNVETEVLYLTLPSEKQQGAGFGQAFKWDIPLLDGYKWNEVESQYLKRNLGIEKFSALKLTKTRKLLQCINPDAVFLTGWQSLALIQVLIACKTLKIPTLIRGDSNNLKPRSWKIKLLHRLIISQFDRYLTVGKANEHFYKDIGIKSSKLYFCPHFVDNNYFAEKSKLSNAEKQTLKERWSIPESSFCFCYVGKLNAKKRIMDVLAAFKDSNITGSHLLVVGSGELIMQAKNYVRNNHLSVSFTGFLNQSEIPNAYAVSNCLVLASDYDETWGLVANEAMVCSIPAIISDRCGCHLDLIKENENGFIFNYSNITALSDKMKKITDLPKEQYKIFCERAKNKVSKTYTIEQATKGLSDALSSLSIKN